MLAAVALGGSSLPVAGANVTEGLSILPVLDVSISTAAIDYGPLSPGNGASATFTVDATVAANSSFVGQVAAGDFTDGGVNIIPAADRWGQLSGSVGCLSAQGPLLFRDFAPGGSFDDGLDDFIGSPAPAALCRTELYVQVTDPSTPVAAYSSSISFSFQSS
jgi:hypothetical protein